MTDSTPQRPGLKELRQLLERKRIEGETERLKEENRRKRLMDDWTNIEPILMRAVEPINAELAAQSAIHVRASAPGFVGRDGDAYGVSCTVENVKDGRLSLVVAYDCLYVGYHGLKWSEGIKVPLGGLTLAVAIDKIARAVRDIIAEEPR